MSQPHHNLQLEHARELINRGELTEAEEILTKVEKNLDGASAKKEMIIDLKNEKGKILFRRGNYEAAKHLLEEALSNARECSYEYGVGYALHYLGATTWNLGEADHALDLYEQALNIRRRIGDHRGATASLHNIAMCQSQRGNIREALALYKVSKDSIGQKLTMKALREVYILLGDDEKARE
ncbi:MAG: tetratricopeptide repeat protein, partial [Candidatus Heimdallarchaeota archaeon]